MQSTLGSQITIRPDRSDDGRALRRLAALDSALVPQSPLLVAEVDGELRVALSVGDGSVIADPFHPTAELIALLRAHLHATAPSRGRRGRGRRRLRSRALAALAGG